MPNFCQYNKSVRLNNRNMHCRCIYLLLSLMDLPPLCLKGFSNRIPITLFMTVGLKLGLWLIHNTISFRGNFAWLGV